MATTSHIATGARLTTEALSFYIKEQIAPIYSRSRILGYLRKYGRLSFNNGGQDLVWRPRFRRRNISAGGGHPTAISFPETNVRQQCTLPWRQYDLGEAVSKFEELVTQGKEAYFSRRLKGVIDDLTEDFLRDFASKLYLDGNLAANAQDVHGFESWYSYSGLVSGSYCGNPNDSYAGHSTALAVSGSWTGNWPVGTGDAESHWWSPLIVDYQNTGFGGSTNNWKNQWQEALNYASTYLSVLQSRDADTLLCNPELERLAKDSLKSSQRIVVEKEAGPKGLGFPRLKYEQFEIVSEQDTPADTAYLIPWDVLKLYSMQGDIIGHNQDRDIYTSQTLYALDAFVQMKIESPAFMPKLYPISALGT